MIHNKRRILPSCCFRQSIVYLISFQRRKEYGGGGWSFDGVDGAGGSVLLGLLVCLVCLF